MKFYSVQTRETVDVSDNDVAVITMKNGKKAAKAQVNKDGKTLNLFKIIGNEDLKRLDK